MSNFLTGWSSDAFPQITVDILSTMGLTPACKCAALAVGVTNMTTVTLLWCYQNMFIMRMLKTSTTHLDSRRWSSEDRRRSLSASSSLSSMSASLELDERSTFTELFVLFVDFFFFFFSFFRLCFSRLSCVTHSWLHVLTNIHWVMYLDVICHLDLTFKLLF